jgi:hypothetical protein
VLSVVTATPDGFGRLRILLRHLAAQTIAGRLELIVVAPDEVPMDAKCAEVVAALGRVTVLPVGPIDDADRSLAQGVRKAQAPVVALVEDHAYPEPEWAEALVAAHRGPWAAVGPAFRNANPGSGFSWANMLLAYGHWTGRDEPGAMPYIARHNSSFKLDVLLSYGEELELRLARSGGLLEDLARQGKVLYFEPRAKIAHVNPSRLVSTLKVRFDSGRLSAATRVEREAWSSKRRLKHVLGFPLIPVGRFRGVLEVIRPVPELRARFPKTLPALVLALGADAVGQAVGFALGPGRAEERIRSYELYRRPLVRSADRAFLST